MEDRKLVELALEEKDVSAITPDIIAKTIDEVARHKRVFSQLFRENRDLTRTKGRRIIIPKFVSKIKVISGVGAQASIPPSTFSYQGTTIDVVKFGIRFEADIEALESPVRDVLKDALAIGAREWAYELDKRACTIALDLKEGTITSWINGTLGAATAPVIQITSEIGCTIDAVDYYKGSIALTGSVSAATVTYLYSSRLKSTGQYINAEHPETLRVDDVIRLRGTLIASSMNPDILLVNNNDLPNFLYDAVASNLFIPACLYSDEKTLAGEIGKIVDLKVLSSGLVPEGIGIIVDSNRLGYDVIKRDLTATIEKKEEYDQIWYHLWAEREFGVSDDLAIGIVTNCKQGKYRAKNM